MRKLIALLLFSCVVFLSSAQVLNTKFPLGSYSGRLRDGSFAENTLISCHIIDEQYVFMSVLFDIDLGFGENKEPVPFEFITKYILRNDTLFFEQHDDTVPYFVYYQPEDIVSETGEVITIQTKISKMFETYDLTVRPKEKNKSQREIHNEKSSFTDETVINMSFRAKAGDTLWVATSMGEHGFIIPDKVNKINLIPNIPNLGFEYAYKGESVNELIFKTGITTNEATTFYVGAVSDTDLMKAKEKHSFGTDNTFIQACESISREENVPMYTNDDEYAYNYNEDNYLTREDTIRYSYSYKDALKIAKEENLFIRIFYVQGDQCVNEYLKRIRTLNQEYYYYDNEYRQLMSFILVFLNEKDSKLVQRWGITKPDTDFILSSDELLLYQKKITCKNEYDISLFSSDEKYLNEELQFIYMDQAIAPRLIKNPNDVKALKLYLDKINQIIQTIDHFSYNDPWTVYISNREYYFEHIAPQKIPSAGTIITYLDNYAKAKMNAPFDTTLAKMIITFYNVVYGNEISASVSSFPVKYLMKHAKVLDRLQISESYRYRTLYEIVYKSLINLKSEYQNKYTQTEILEIYQEAIKEFPEYEDYFYLLCYYALDLTAISPDFYTDLLAFYKAYLQKLQNVSDWDDYIQTLNGQVALFEKSSGEIKVRDAEKLYKILPHLAWIIGLQEGREGENITLALQCAKIAGLYSIEYYDNQYITPNYVALLYLLGYKDEAIAVQKAYCADKADSYSDYDQEMMYMLKAMALDVYEPRIVVKNN